MFAGSSTIWIFRLSLSINVISLLYFSQNCWPNLNTSSPMCPSSVPLRNSTPLKIVECDNITPRRSITQRGNYWVLYNYVTSTRKFACDESITFATHGDFTFLDNLVSLTERWRGPISIAVYAPGSDFEDSIQRIIHLRQCIPLVKEFVNFHLFFDFKHMPESIPENPMDSNDQINCSIKLHGGHPQTYKQNASLLYPVNVARNSAREMATTHFVLVSDIELFPSPNLVPKFLDMIRRNRDERQRQTAPKVYVLHTFEVQKSAPVPNNKSDLVRMLQNKSAIPFHLYVCPNCHTIPKALEWNKFIPSNGQLNVFHVAKRTSVWEPIFIGSKFDPLYDERLTWEGHSDKMTQAFTLCNLDYEFHILDDAFLVHKPGIKVFKNLKIQEDWVKAQNKLIGEEILPELELLYGHRKGCGK